MNERSAVSDAWINSVGDEAFDMACVDETIAQLSKVRDDT